MRIEHADGRFSIGGLGQQTVWRAAETDVMCFKFQKTLNKDNKHEDNNAIAIRAYNLFTIIPSGGDIGYSENNVHENRNDERVC